MSKANELFNQAERFYEDGKLSESVRFYLLALQEYPDFIDALINLSVTLIELNQKEEALRHLHRALQLDKNNYIIITNYANLLFSLNKVDEALNYYLHALNINPNSIEIKKNISNVLISQGKYENAIIYLNELINDDIAQKDVLIKLTHCLNSLKRHEEALKIVLKCHRIYPRDCEVINSLAQTFESLGDIDKAENCYRQIVRLEPTNYVYYFNLALLLKKKGLKEDAVYYFKRSVEIKSDFQEGLLELANTLKSLKRYKEAVDIYKNLLDIHPNSPIVLNNIGTTYYEMKEYAIAFRFLNEAIKQKPDFASAYFNRGLVYKDTFQNDNAIDDYVRALGINANYPEAHWNLGLLYLIKGDFENGWKHYEWRKKLSVYEPFKRHFIQPEWQGESLINKTILLHDEQGFGDAIQFIRYAKMVKDMGAKVFIECLEPLTRLFLYADGVDNVVTRGHELPDFDCYCSLLTLPLRFNTTLQTIPQEIPYIKPIFQVKKRTADEIFKVGIAWAGINPQHKSCPVDVFMNIFYDINRVEVHNLQKIMTDTDKDFIESKGVINKMESVKDFLDTAIIMSNLDLVITIDTSVAHLSGAMGLNVWTLLHYDADWRWLLQREDTPWYPTMRLFRQKTYGDWSGIVREVNENLSKLITVSRY